MSNFEDIFSGFLNSQSTSNYKDLSMIEIIGRKVEFENNLDDIWMEYSRGIVKQIVEYNKAVNQIKNVGLKVFRNSAGKHKIVMPK